MGTKSVEKNGCEKKNLKNDVHLSKEVSVDEGFSPSSNKEKKKRKRHEAEGNNSEMLAAEMDGVNAEVDVHENNHKIEKNKNEEKKRKKKLEKRDNDMESCEVGKQDKAFDSGGEIETEVNLKDDKTGAAVNMGLLQESGAEKETEKKHKRKKGRVKNDSASSAISVLKSNSRESVGEGQKVCSRGDVSEMNNGEDGGRKKKKNKKQKMHGDGGDVQVMTNVTCTNKGERDKFNNRRITDDIESSQKERKKKKQLNNVDLGAKSAKSVVETSGNKREAIEEDGDNIHSAGNKSGKGKLGVHDVNKDKKKKRKKQKRGQGTDGGDEANNPLEKSTSKRASKRVSFSEEVEVFPSSDGPSDDDTREKKGLVQGKRFSPEEDELVKQAVFDYINYHGLGEDGLKMVLECKKHRELKNCWKEIGQAIPWRPYGSVYYRAHILFERDEKRSWTEEELALVRNYHEKYGSDWKTLADVLGKHRFHVKDAWRRIKLTTRQRGKWSQDEYQQLFDLVNMDLRMKALEETRPSKHGMLRDNISWTAISDKLRTRTTPMCCMKWYDQLTSPMVAEGKWLDVDDFYLLIALYDLDACCMEDVEWDDLLEHRPGEICRKRWNQMVKHLGEHGNRSFADQVEVLIQRYCPDVLEAREAYNSKPVVP